jgi:hypothetical protein
MLFKSKFSAKNQLPYYIYMVVLLGAGVVILYQNFSLLNWRFIGVQLGVLCVIGSLLIARYLLRLPLYKFYEGYVEITDAINNHKATVAYKDIVSQKVEYYHKGDEDWSRIVLVLVTGKSYRIASYNYTNYEDITAFLHDKVNGEAPSANITKPVNNKWWAMAGLVLGFIAAWLFTSAYIRAQIPDADLAIVKGTISAKASTKKSGKYSYTIPIQLNEYPGFTFVVEHEAYSTMDKELYLANVAKGDSLAITVLKRDKDIKLTKTVPASFTDLHDRYNSIAVYALRSGKQEYLTVKQFRNSYKNLYSLENIICLVCLGFFINALYRLYFRVKKGSW